MYARLTTELKQFFGLQLDRGNLSNALTDNFLGDLQMSTNDYNNVYHLVYSYISARLPSPGNNYTAHLLSRCGVPGADAHKEIWISCCASYHDDGLVNYLCVCPLLVLALTTDCSVQRGHRPGLHLVPHFM